MRVGKANLWLWVFHHGDSAAFVAEASRSKAVVEKFLGDWRLDVWVVNLAGQPDRLGSREHEFCLAHPTATSNTSSIKARPRSRPA